MIKLSVVVPTHNRADYLAEALASFSNQSLDPAAYEILVIDNNSTDHTGHVVQEVMNQARCSWTYKVETNQGLHHARNRGIAEARGEIVVIGDDDTVAGESWLSSIFGEFERHPATGIVGGRVMPIWSRPPEPWIYDYGTAHVHPLFAYLDYGDERLVLEHEYVFGCNFAIRRSLALMIGGSYPDTFPRHLKHLSGTGESAMIDIARKLGYEIVYLPDAAVCHHVSPSRVTLDYFVDRYERWAVEDVFDAFRHRSKKEAVRYLLQLAFERRYHAETESRDKINPDYYRVINRHWAQQMIKQTFRVLTEPDLYEHITRESYL